ncbi:TetR/AcrR family transcriptional regulator [Streptomyces sp. XH2]|uniref:TetR/AcrR family transcriptional regulator n=1 Tax=Streptomyces sp. XH2 TaxID=3412483 RepID=UPI003C7A24FA
MAHEVRSAALHHPAEHESFGPGRAELEAQRGPAQALGVTRGGFYRHFKDRGALLEEMLDTWERMSTDEVIERVENEGGDARDKVRRAGALTFSQTLLPIDLDHGTHSRTDVLDTATRLLLA